jgi:hypothetical protein
MSLNVRPARRGDGAGIARVWLSAAAYYAELDPAHFQLPRADGLAGEWDGQLGQDREESLRLVAEVDGRVVGWLSARLEPPEDSAAVQLTREHGDPACRGRPARRPPLVAPRRGHGTARRRRDLGT